MEKTTQRCISKDILLRIQKQINRRIERDKETENFRDLVQAQDSMRMISNFIAYCDGEIDDSDLTLSILY